MKYKEKATFRLFAATCVKGRTRASILLYNLTVVAALLGHRHVQISSAFIGLSVT
jgi:hypothetical protein